jgi:hypothetical protein
MEKHQTISGAEAVRRARNLKFVPGAHFTLVHLTCNMKTGECGGLVKKERCRVRPSLREDTFTMDGDMYFPYEDLDGELPGMCFKRLMRYIGFPPGYELLKIDWFDGED